MPDSDSTGAAPDPPEGARKAISIYTYEERVHAMDAIADRERRTRSWLIDEAMREYIERYHADHPTIPATTTEEHA